MLPPTLVCLFPLLLLTACASTPTNTAQKSTPTAATGISTADNTEECEETARTGSHVKQKTCQAANTSGPSGRPLVPMDSVRASAPGAIR